MQGGQPFGAQQQGFAYQQAPQGGPQWYGPQHHQQQLFGAPQGQQPWAPYGPPVHPPRPRRSRRKLTAIVGVLSLATATVIGSVAWGIDQQSNSSSSSQLSQVMDAAAVAAAVSPGLVNVNTVLGYEGARAAGTGMVLTSDGEVLTNHHVVEGATEISVTSVATGKTYQASVVGYDETHDIAVLQVKDASGLQTVKTGDSSKVAIGDQVVGIGNTGGDGGEPGYAAGEVTGLNQAITATDSSGGNAENLTGLIETDANIQAGDSGGPLANASGEVIGMDTAGSASNGSTGGPGSTGAGSTGTGSTGQTAFGPGTGPGYGSGGSGQGQEQTPTTTQGYAVPINQALDIAEQIEDGDASSTIHIGATPMLGISVLADSAATGTSGAVVGDVVAAGKADDAGIVAGDVITAIDGKTVDSPDTLSSLLDQHHPGDKIKVTWVDQAGQQHTATIELITGPVG